VAAGVAGFDGPVDGRTKPLPQPQRFPRMAAQRVIPSPREKTRIEVVFIGLLPGRRGK
jgi:hypothetical protein